MHIPDGFLTPATYLSAWLASAGFLTGFLKRLAGTLQDRAVPLMAVLAAFIFAAQMLNFPVYAGTSGHLLGGVLAAVLVGPYAGAVILSLVLAVQALVFQDGGLTALGANIFNMALAGAFLGYFIYAGLLRLLGPARRLWAAGAAAWFSVVLAAGLCGLQLAISGVAPLGLVLPAMLFIHLFIGLGEALITVAILEAVLRVRPELVYQLEAERP